MSIKSAPVLPLFCEYRRALKRLSFIQAQDADREDVTEEARFCVSVSSDLHFMFKENMRRVRFSGGFWAMLSAFIDNLSHKQLFFEQFIEACVQLEQSPIGTPYSVHTHAIFLSGGQEIPHLKWRSTLLGTLVVFDICYLGSTIKI